MDIEHSTQALQTLMDTTPLAVGSGSAASFATDAALLRWIADNLPGGSTEVQTSNLNQGTGSRASLARAGLIIRFLADELETSSIASGAGSNATLTSAGSLLRWLVDNVGLASTLTILSDATNGLAAIKAEEQSTGLATGAGSNATLTRLGSLVRWLVDNGALASVLGTPAGASIAADISAIRTLIGTTGSGLTSLAQAATALSTATWTGTMAGYLDAAISSRLASASYTAPDNTNIGNINTKIGTVTNTGGTATIGSILGDFANSTIKTRFDTIDTELQGGTLAVNDVAGKWQYLRVTITSAANSAAVTVATAANQSVEIQTVSVRAVAAQTSDLTSFTITGGTAGVLTMIPSSLGLQSNLNATDAEVAASGIWVIPSGGTVKFTPTGTGATALNLIVNIAYRAAANGGHF